MSEGNPPERMDSSSIPEVSSANVEDESKIDEILRLICSRLKIERDRGVKFLDSLLKKWEKDKSQGQDEVIGKEKKKLEKFILDLLDSESTMEIEMEGQEEVVPTIPILEWEVKHGCLMACYPLIASMNREIDAVFLGKIEKIAMKFLRDEEIKVQQVAGGVLGFLSKYKGPSVYETSRELLMELILKNLQTGTREPDEELISPEQGFDVNISATLIKKKVTREAREWKPLEPSLKCLQFMIENLDADFILLIDQRLVNIIMSCLAHSNRYIRETGLQICTALILAAPENVMEFGHQLSEKLSVGLTDPWNQVRLAALVTTRTFLVKTNSREEFFPQLLPRLCLNRYYKAEGVRVFTHETWRIIVGTEGRFLVARFINDFVNFYIEISKSGNPADREAAASCISELVQKIEKEPVQPHVSRLLQTLIECCDDVIWSVRDAAALSLGNFTTSYSEIAKAYLDTIYEILFKNLEHPIVLLRQGAATSLANLTKAYGNETLSLLLDRISIGLKSVENMRQADTSTETESEQAPMSDNACQNCGLGFTSPEKLDLLAKLPGGTTVITSCSRSRPCEHDKPLQLSQPWHLADGCMYLTGALAELTTCQRELSSLIPLMVDATKVRNYGEHYILVETLCKVIPVIARKIGKRPFKEFLVLIFEPIFYAMESQSPQTVALASQCISFLEDFIGPNILKSRVEDYDPRLLHLLQKPR